MARKSTGRTRKPSRSRTSASSARSTDQGKSSSSRKSSSHAAASHRRSEDRKVVSISGGRKESSAAGRESTPRPSSVRSTRANTRVLTDHDEIRRWAAERGAQPAHVPRTGEDDDVGIIRLVFPRNEGEEALEELSWGEWFGKFDENGLALVVEDRTPGGQRSSFNKLVNRETVKAMAEASGRPPRPNRAA